VKNLDTQNARFLQISCISLKNKNCQSVNKFDSALSDSCAKPPFGLWGSA
jgi:hypothetical protein